MANLRGWIFRLSWFLGRRRREAEMARELAHHLELERHSNLERGLSESEARRLAGVRFGAVEATKEYCREAAGMRWFDDLSGDLRQGLRLIARAPGFSFVVVAVLGLGIGGTAAISSVVESVLLRPLPFPEPARLAMIWENDRVQGTSREAASYPDFLDIRAQTSSFEELAAYQRSDRTLQGNELAERLSVARVSPAYFRLLGVEPLIGSGPPEEAEAARGGPVVLLSEGLWRRRFGADETIIGRTVVFDGEPHEVVGVMPRRAVVPSNSEVAWVPLIEGELDRLRGRHSTRVYARLRAGVSLAAAQAEMDTLMARLEREHYQDNRGRGARVVALADDLVRDAKPMLLLLLGAVAAVLLLSGFNIAGLLLARGEARRAEMAVREALGGRRGRLLRQLLVESLVLAAVGTTLGLLVAAVGTEALLRLAPPDIPRLTETGWSSSVAAISVAAALMVWLPCSLLPASRVAISRRGLGAGRGVLGAGGERQRLRRLLVIAQLALSLVLLAATAVLVQNLWRLQRVELGFDARGVTTASFELPAASYPFPRGWPVVDWKEGNAFSNELLARLRFLPGVDAAALALYAPNDGGWTTRVLVEGRPEPPLEAVEEAHYRPVSEGYFEAVRLPIVAGRSFTAADRAGEPEVAIINTAFVRRYFADENPLGARIRIYGRGKEIVGVAAEERFLGAVAGAEPTMYLPTVQSPQPRQMIIVRSQLPTPSMAAAVRGLLRELDADLALFDVTDLEAAVSGSLASRRFTLGLLGGFAAMAVLLAALGLYGLLSYQVEQRTHEIGLRLALGARPGAIERLVLARALGLWLLGALVGGIAIAMGSGLLERLVPGLDGGDMAGVFGAPLVLLVVAVLASWLPAHRASRLDPQVALRRE